MEKKELLKQIGGVIYKVVIVMAFFIVGYIIIASCVRAEHETWNHNVSADVAFADGKSAHFNSNIFSLLNKGDSLKIHVRLPASERPEYNAVLCFCVYNSLVTAKYGDAVIYSYGQDIHARGNMIGGVYAAVPIPDDAWGDEIVIELLITENYAFSKVRSFDLYPATLAYKNLLSNNILNFFISITGATCSIIALALLLVMWRRKSTLAGLYIALFALLASIWIFTNCGLHRLFSDSYFWVPLEYISLYSLPIPLLGYLIQTSARKLSRILDAVLIVISLLFTGVTSALNFTGVLHFCDTLTAAHLLLLVDVIFMMLMAMYRVWKREASAKYFLIGIALITAVGLFDLLRFNLIRYIPALYGSMMPSVMAVGLAAFVSMLITAFNSDIKAEREKVIIQEQDIKRLETELENSRIKVMVSQMQPHFLYNALSAIRAITKTNPDYAYDLLYDFTVHLRANIKALSSDVPIPFSDELANIEAYLNIEKMRFGDKLQIQYDIRCDDFSIIPLSIQPIAENAVRHGIYPKGKAGGTVIIRTRQTETHYIVEVQDDGVGFDVNQVLKEKPDSVGLRSLIFRLHNIMDAEVKIDSSPVTGTCVTVVLQKERKG